MERRANRDDVIGRQVGRYTIVGHLATGGMAELYIARQEAVGGFEKNLVIKVLQSRYAQHPRVERMFLDEARLAAKLNHPSIVHVYDVAEEDGSKFIAMEYIHGETLTDIIKRGVGVGSFLPLEHAVHIVSQVAAGLDYAHRRHDPNGGLLRIVHRDVSPSNIMVSYEGQTKIIDFGIARVQDQIREESGMHPGKASYMSPEQVAGEPVDYRSDIFSLGIILYEITLGRRLWRGPAEEVMKRIASEPAPLPSMIRKDYPPMLEAIVMKALQKRPDDRQQSAEELRHDLEEFLAAGSFRTGAHQTAVYLRELFPIKAALSDEGIVQPKGPMEGDSAPLPIISGGGETGPPVATLAAGPGAAPSSYPAGMTVLTQVPAKSGARPERIGGGSSAHLIVPRGPSNAKLALIAAAITFAGVTAVILIVRTRRPDVAIASPPVGEGPAPNAAPAAEQPLRGNAEPQPQPETSIPPSERPPSESPPAAERAPLAVHVPASVSARAAAEAHPSASERAHNRHQRRQTVSSELSRELNRDSSSARTSTSASPPPPPSSAPSASASEPTRSASAAETAAHPASRPSPPAAGPSPSTDVEHAAPAAPPPGFVDSKAVHAVVRAHAAEVQGCFDRALMEHADLHGRLTVRASIDPNGRVLGVTPTADMQGGGRLEACVVEAFERWTFPPPAGGVKGTVSYSFSFE